MNMDGFIDNDLVKCEGIAQIQHSTTNKIYDIDGSELIDWECVHYDEINPMYASTYECKIEYDDLGLLTWQCGHGAMDVNVGSHQLINDFKDSDFVICTV